MRRRDLESALARLADPRVLGLEEALATFDALADRTAPPVPKAAILGALLARGVRAEELARFARAMLARARGPIRRRSPILLDTYGTGGDGSDSFNLSTATALLLAAEGFPVAKHGNRSVSSRCGSADLIEALGIEFARSPAHAERELAARGFTFLFARAFHPAAAEIAAVRRELGVRTVFNLLGPLVNPARPTHQLTGTGDIETAACMAGALACLDTERAFVVVGAGGWDEATQAGPFELFDVRPGRVERIRFDAATFGLPRCSPEELSGQDAAHNAHLLVRAFSPTRAGRDPVRDAVLLNGALCLLLVGAESSPRSAVQRLRTTIRSGRAASFLHDISPMTDGAIR
ncbi:MAG TPA: anthranilate phosphoribosyltransferase [Planctomycetes bacterium]|nr:anthranilate phosphoribosyltransferase [Planctomycetota bacterium]